MADNALKLLESSETPADVKHTDSSGGAPQFNISEFAALLNVSTSTIRHWEKENKLPQPRRVKRGATEYRLYSAVDVYNARRSLSLPNLFSHKPTFQMFYNMKGGTGKSTLAYNYAAMLACMGHKVLAIDLDGQSHLTMCLKIDTSREYPTIFDAIDPAIKKPLSEIIQPTWIPNLDILPSRDELSTLELFLFQMINKGIVNDSQVILKDVLLPQLRAYDAVVIDTGPNLGLVNVNALHITNDLIVPVKTDYLSVVGMTYLFQQIEDMQTSIGLKFDRVVLLPNMFDIREKICMEAMSFLQSQFKDYVSKTVIRKATAIADATKLSEAVFMSAGRSSGAKDIVAFVREMLRITPNEGDYWT